MLKFLFLLAYMGITSFDIFIQDKVEKQNIILLIAAVAVSGGLYFPLEGMIGAWSLLACVLLGRLAVPVLSLISKSFWGNLVLTLPKLGFDAILLFSINAKDILWQYICLGVVAIFCIVRLTPLSNMKQKSVQWLTEQDLKTSAPIILLPLISPVTTLIMYFTVSVNSVYKLYALSLVLTLINFAFTVLQQYICIQRINKELISAMYEWQSGTRDYMNKIRSQRHDFNFHLHAISGLIASEKFEECKAYAEKLVNEAAQINDIMPVYDAVIGSMLSNMREKAKDKGIALTYDIKNDMKDIVCNAFELNKIMGNLIQNAIDAVNSDDEKSHGIQVSVFGKRGNTVIVVENYCEQIPENFEHMFDLGFSTKLGHEGLGLSMVEKTLKNYSGKIYVELNGNTIRFVAHIPNRLRED